MRDTTNQEDKTMKKDIFKNALTGSRNLKLKEMLSYMIDISDSIENIDGKIIMNVSLMSFDESTGIGIAAWDNNENCNALVTHDLRQFKVFDLSGLIQKMRIN